MSISHPKNSSVVSASLKLDLCHADERSAKKFRQNSLSAKGFRARNHAGLTPFQKAIAFSLGLSVVGFTPLCMESAQAATYYWDNNGATAGFGTAGGMWSSTASLFSTDATGVTAPAGTVATTTADLINFGTATLGLGTGTITVNGTVSAGSITYGAASGAITLSGGTINLGSATASGIINNSTSLQTFSSNIVLGVSQTWNLGAGGAIFNNAISGAFATRIDSTGIVTLAASNSGDTGVTTGIGGVNYTESFRLNSGTTVVGTSTSLGTGAVDIRSTLAASTALTGANKLTNTFVIATGTATIGGSNNIELGGSFVSSNGGTANTLAVTNTGATTVSGTVFLSDSATVTKGLVVDVSLAAGTTTINGVIQNFTTAGSGIAGAFTKNNFGTLVLSNNNTYTGATTVNAGTLVEDFSNLATPTNVISGSSALTLGGGTLNLKAQSGSTTAQTFNGLTLTGGTSSVISVAQNGATAVNLTLGNITRGAQSALDVTLPTAGAVTTTATGNSGGLLADPNGVSYATANGGTTWLASTGPSPFALSALTTYSTGNANYVTGNNVDVTNGDSVANVTVNTLRFNGANTGLTLAGTNIVNAGGILDTPSGTGSSITGGSLTSSTTAAEVIIHNYGSLNVGSAIVNANAGATATKLTLTGPGTTTLSGANTYTGATSVNTGKLNVTGSITASSTIAVGAPSTAGAAVYQSGSGSVVTNTSTGGGGFQIGSAPGAVGYYNLAGGTVNAGGEFDSGGPGGGAGTFGQLDMSGGTINIGAASATAAPFFLPVRGAAGEASVVNISGGTVQVNSGNTVANGAFNGLAVGLSNVGNLTSTITISGTGQFLTPSLTTKLNDTNFGNAAGGNATNASVLNMNGGTLQTLGFGTAVNAGGGNGFAVLNFNGGTIKAGSAGNTNFLTGLGAVNVYSGGGTIDNNGQAITVGQSMLAASGTGVSSVTVGTTGTGYIAPPRVVFSGGTLTSGLLANAATGYTTIDPTTGAVTGIVITNPGSYTSTAGLTANLTGPTGGTLAAIGALTLNTGNTSGGITYLGSGTTTLSGASTYTGATSISVGTVRNGVANAIPVGSALTVSGGTYNLNGFADGVASLSDGGVSTGTVTNSGTVAALSTNGTASTTFSGLISGTVNLLQQGASTLTLSNASNSYTGGTTIGAGQNGAVLRATASGALGTGTLSLDSGGNASTARLELAGGITLANAIAFTGRGNASVGIENISGNNTLSGLVSLNSGGGTYIVQSDAGTLAFTNTGTSTIGGNKTLTFTGAGNGSFAGVLTSVAQTSPNLSGGVAKSGAGQWTLTGANTYLGATSITGGTLSAASTTGNSLGSTSGIAVSGGGTLLLSQPNQVLASAVASTTAPAAAVMLGVTATSVGNVTAAAGASQGTAATASGGTFTGTTAQGLGALTLNNTATLTFSGASTTLVFNTFTPNGNVLTISGYTNFNANSSTLTSGSGTDDRLVFFGDQSLNYGNFNFGAGAGVGISEVALDNGFYEVYGTVPEPTTILGGILLLGVAGYRGRRRLSSLWHA